MREVWDTTFFTSSKTIDVHLGWLRRKLGDDSRVPAPDHHRPRPRAALRDRADRDAPDPAGPLGRVTRLAGVPEPAPTLAVIGGGQLARMMAAARGRPRASRCGCSPRREGVSAAQVIPDHAGRRLHRPRRRCARSPTAARWSPSTTSTCPPSTCTRSRPTGIAVRPGPEALVHAQDKGVMRARLAELGVPCPRNARGRTRSADVGGVRLPVRAEDHPRRLRRQGRLVRRGRRATAPSRLRGRRASRRAAARRGAASTSAASCPRWWPARPAARPRRTRSSPRTQVDGICREVDRPGARPRPGAGRRRRSRSR